MVEPLGEALLQTGVDFVGLERDLAKTESKLAGSSKALISVGSTITKAVTLPIAGAAAAGVKFASDLDAEMRNIQSVGGQTERQLADLSDTFVDMSRDINVTVDTASNLAAGFYDIQGSGFAGAEAMEVLEAATKAASAGLTDTEVSGRALTAVLNAYNLEAKDAGGISDILFKTVDVGVGSFEELAGSVAQVVPTAAQAGISFDEVAAGLATMSKQGFSFAESATALNQLIVRFLDPGEEMAGIISDMGYQSGLALIQAEGLSGAVARFTEATGGAADVSARLLGNIRAQRAAAALASGDMEMFTGDLEAMGDAAGTTAHAFEVQSQSFAMQAKSFRNELQAIGIEVGQELLPILRDLMRDVLRPLIDRFLDMDEASQKNLLRLAALAAGVGPVLVGLGQLLNLVASVQTVMTMATGATVGFGTAAATVVAPVAALAAAVIALKKAHEFNEEVTERETEVHSKWASELRKAVDEEESAVAVAERYAAAQEKVNQAYADAPWYVQPFIDKTEVAHAETSDLQGALVASATSYEDYYEAARRAGLVTEEGAREMGVLNYEHYRAEQVLQGNAVALREWEYEVVRAVEAERDLNRALKDGAITQAEYQSHVAAANPELATLSMNVKETTDGVVCLAEAFGEGRPKVYDFTDVEIQAADATETLAEKMAIASGRGVDFNETMERMHEEAERYRETMDGLARDIAGPLGQMEDELDSHHDDMAELEREHREKMAELAGGDLQAEAQRRAGQQLADERQEVLDEIARLEERHNERIQIYQAQGKQKSIENENARFEIQKANLEAQLDELEGNYSAYYANHLSRLSANRDEALRIEDERYEEEKRKAEEAHAERIKLLKQQTAQMLIERTKELVLMGEITSEQANQLVGAMAAEIGLGVDSSEQAVIDILGSFQDWAEGGTTTVSDIALGIANVDTAMSEYEQKEKERQQRLAEEYEAQKKAHDEMRQAQIERTRGLETQYVDLEETFGETTGNMADDAENNIPPVSQKFDELKRKIGDVPDEKEITISAKDEATRVTDEVKRSLDEIPDEKIFRIKGIYDPAGPEMQMGSPLGIHKALIDAVEYASNNPIVALAGMAGAVGPYGASSASGDTFAPVFHVPSGVAADRPALSEMADRVNQTLMTQGHQALGG